MAGTLTGFKPEESEESAACTTMTRIWCRGAGLVPMKGRPSGQLRQATLCGHPGAVRAGRSCAHSLGNALLLQKVSLPLLDELALLRPSLLPGEDVVAFGDIDLQQRRVYSQRKIDRCALRPHPPSSRCAVGGDVHAST